MNRHWHILNLDPESATEREVKRAYARLLKQHRPDEAPEEFKRLHEAYHRALAELQWCERYGEPASSFPAPDPFPASERPADFRSHSVSAIAQPEEWDTHEAATLADLLNELEGGQTGRALHMLRGLALDDPEDAKRAMARAILDEEARFANEPAALFACELASALAFTHRETSEALMDFAYSVLPLDRRKEVEYPNRMVLLGHMLYPSVKKKYYGFWNAALLYPADIDWDGELAGKALRQVDRIGQWVGYPVIDGVVPPEKQIWYQRRFLPKPDPRLWEDTLVGKLRRNLFIVCFFAIAFVLFLGILYIYYDARISKPQISEELAAEGWEAKRPGEMEKHSLEEYAQIHHPMHGFAVVHKGQNEVGEDEFHVYRGGLKKVFTEADYREWEEENRNIRKGLEILRERNAKRAISAMPEVPDVLEIAREIQFEGFSYGPSTECDGVVEWLAENGPLKTELVFGSDWKPDEIPPRLTERDLPGDRHEPAPVILVDGTKVSFSSCDVSNFTGTYEELLGELATQNGLRIIEKGNELYFSK